MPYSSILSPIFRQRLAAKEPRWDALLILRSIALVFSLIGTILFTIVTVFMVNYNYIGYDTDELCLWALLPITVVNAVEFFILCCLPYHPTVISAVNIVVDLSCWVALLAIATIAQTTFSELRADTLYLRKRDIPQQPSCGRPYGATQWNFYGFGSESACDKAVFGYFNMERAGIAFMIMGIVVHFALWVMACRRTDTQRKAKWVAKRTSQVQNNGQGIELGKV